VIRLDFCSTQISLADLCSLICVEHYSIFVDVTAVDSWRIQRPITDSDTFLSHPQISQKNISTDEEMEWKYKLTRGIAT
jgi:hypothetical protein